MLVPRPLFIQPLSIKKNNYPELARCLEQPRIGESRQTSKRFILMPLYQASQIRYFFSAQPTDFVRMPSTCEQLCNPRQLIITLVACCERESLHVAFRSLNRMHKPQQR